MFFSDLQPSGSYVRQPRATVKVNGIVITSVIEVETSSTANFHGDRFRIVMAMSGLPANLNQNYFDSSVGDEVDVSIRINDGLDQAIIHGQVDDVEYNPVKRTIILSGRDFSSIFMDTKVTKSYHDAKSSDIVTAILAQHKDTHGNNIIAADITPTPKRVGSYSQINAKISACRSEWDLMVILAQEENYDLWVSGKTLHFKPIINSAADPYILLWSELSPGNLSSNAMNLELGRSQTLARDIVVEVLSWNQAQSRVFKATAKRSKSGVTKARNYETLQTYRFFPANLSQEQVNKFADAKADEISRHEKTLSVSMPGDVLLNVRAPVKLVGTGTAWDQIYYPDTIMRRLSQHEGYVMDLRAKNHGAVIES